MAGERTYTARALTANDIFLCVRILNKIGMKEIRGCFSAPEVKAAIASAAGGQEEAASGVGMTVMMEIAGVMLERLPECRNEIYDLLASLFGMESGEVGELDIVTFTRLVMEVIRKEEFRDFFRVVFGSSR